ncbi:hypothetical protein D5086_007635 [Populus alba]|uniref:Uncharacterized protein n=1 Tax=Populus alba TaxID=43335 RepID=A0ACC4CP32_POPAL
MLLRLSLQASSGEKAPSLAFSLQTGWWDMPLFSFSSIFLAIPSFMASPLHHLFFLSALCFSSSAPLHQIIFLSSSSGDGGEAPEIAEADHLQLLSSIIPSHESERISLIRHYSHAFKGFSAMLTENEASVLAGHDGISIHLPGSNSSTSYYTFMDFLEAASGIAIQSTSNLSMSSDVIIGMIDTGIWPDPPSFPMMMELGKSLQDGKGACMKDMTSRNPIAIGSDRARY